MRMGIGSSSSSSDEEVHDDDEGTEKKLGRGEVDREGTGLEVREDRAERDGCR